MSSAIIKFLMSKMGISFIAIALIFVVGGIQQLRINSYQAEAKVLIKEKAKLSFTVNLQKAESLALKSAIDKQNDKVNELNLSAAADKKTRENNVLKVNFKHKQEFKKLKKGKGPEDMNKWLKNILN